MRKLIPLFAVAFLFSGLTLLQAQDKGKEKTITGEGQCAKCSLDGDRVLPERDRDR